MTAADKRRQRMTRSKAGWSGDDLDRLDRGFGFTVRQGSKHRVYSHPRFPELRATVSRTSPLPVGYIQTALEQLDRLDSFAYSTRGEP